MNKIEIGKKNNDGSYAVRIERRGRVIMTPVYLTDSEEREINKLRNKQRWVLQNIVEPKLQQEWNDTHKYGYCPHCHISIPMNGVCDICGYDAKNK